MSFSGSIFKATELVEEMCNEAMQKDPSLTAGAIQRGYGMEASLMSVSLACASTGRMQYIKKKVSNPLNTTISWLKNKMGQADEKKKTILFRGR